MLHFSNQYHYLIWAIHFDLNVSPCAPCCLTVRGSGIIVGYIVCNTLGVVIRLRMRSILQALLCLLLSTIWPRLAPAMGELVKEITYNTMVDSCGLSWLVRYLGLVLWLVWLKLWKLEFLWSMVTLVMEKWWWKILCQYIGHLSSNSDPEFWHHYEGGCSST